MGTMLLMGAGTGTPAVPFSPTNISGLVWFPQSDVQEYQNSNFTTLCTTDGQNVKSWRDQSGNSNDGTNASTPLIFKTGANSRGSKSCVLADGSTTFLNSGNGSSLNVTSAWTFACWMKTGSIVVTANNLSAFFGKDDNVAGRSFDFGLIGNGTTADLRVQINGSNQSASTYTYSANGSWHHVAATWDGTHLNYYQDGVVDSSGPYTGVNANVSTANLYLGGRSFSGAFSGFPGSIQTPLIYNVALTAAQMAQLAGY